VALTAAEADSPPDLASGSVATGLWNSPAAATVTLIDNTIEQSRPLPVLARVQVCANSVHNARSYDGREMKTVKISMNEVLTLWEVADFLKIHRSTVYRLVKRGELPAFRVGTDWRFNRVSIEEWLRSRMQVPNE